MNVIFEQNMQKTIDVMQDVGKWLLESGKNPSKWWQLENLNEKFLLQYAKPEEFYVAIVEGQPAVAAILQESQNSQDWQSVDGNKSTNALYIHWLCVHRKFAGKGLPQLVINFAESRAKENNVKQLRVDTNADELVLRKIYEDLGFNLVKIEKEDYRNTALYQKDIDI